MIGSLGPSGLNNLPTLKPSARTNGAERFQALAPGGHARQLSEHSSERVSPLETAPAPKAKFFAKSSELDTSKVSEADVNTVVQPDENDDSELDFKKILKEKKTQSSQDRPKKVSTSQTQGLPLEESDFKTDDEAIEQANPNINMAPPMRKSFKPEEFFTEISKIETKPQATQPVVREFVDSMEQELGVNPSDLISAMKKLSPEDLSADAQVSMPKILDQLKLDDTQKDRAAQLYQGMLTDLNREKKVTSIEVLSPEDIKKRDLLVGLDRVAQNFFLNDRRLPYTGIDKKQEGEAVAAGTMAAQSTQPASQLSTDPGQDEGGDSSVIFIPKTAAPVGASAAAAQMASAQNISPSNNSTLSSDESDDSLTLGTEAGEFEGLLEKVNAADISVKTNPVPAATPTVTEVPATAFAIQTQKTQNRSSEATSDLKPKTERTTEVAQREPLEKSVDGNETSLAGHEAHLNKAESAPTLKGIDAADPRKQEATNAKEVMESTQGLIKKGGGEMTMKLRPEGLGEVKLKVSVQDGKVHIQMMTENSEAKRILEHGLGDLRKSLETQRLSIDTMSVDLHDPQKNLNSDSNGQQQHQRSLAQEFLGNFREQNESFRNSFFDIPGMKAYRTPLDRARDVQPDDVVNSPRSGRASRRLDLVA